MEVWYCQDDPLWLAYQRFQDRFENDEFVVVAFQAAAVFQTETLHKITDLSSRLAELPYVINVVSITNIDYFRGRDGELIISEFIPEIPHDPAELQRLEAIALNNPLYVGNIISPDGKTAGILIRLKQQEGGINYQREFTDLLYAFLDRETEDGKYDFHVAGATTLLGLQDKASTDDAIIESAASLVLLTSVLFFMHRRAVLVLMSILTVVIINIWIHGLMALCGSTFNMLTGMLVCLVMVIGIAESIHFVSEYKSQYRLNRGPRDAARRAFLLVSIPCLFTSLTTAAGFLSMTISDMRAMQVFSVYAAIAMMMTFVVSMVLLSIWLSYVDKPLPPSRKGNQRRTLQGFLEWVAAVNRKHVKVNIFIAVTVFLVSFSGIFKIETNSHALKYFREGHPFRLATAFIEENLSGTIPLEVILEGPEHSFDNPDTLKRVEELQQFVASHGSAKKTFSVVDYLKEMFQAIHGGDPAYYRLPETRAMVAQLLLLAEGSSGVDDYVDATDFAVARVHGRINNMKNNEFRELNDTVAAKARELFEPTGIASEVVGLVPLGVNLGDYVVDTQVKGFGLALLAIFLMLSLLGRSFKLGLLSMIPNVIPVFLTFGIMGWCNIYLDTGTVMIASVAIGLAVDDTIHFISRFRLLFDRYRNYEQALDETIHSIGRPITITSLVLFFGFGILVISTFLPLVYFGILAAITMVSAMIADFFVLPALIKVFKPFGPEWQIQEGEREKAKGESFGGVHCPSVLD